MTYFICNHDRSFSLQYVLQAKLYFCNEYICAINRICCEIILIMKYISSIYSKVNLPEHTLVLYIIVHMYQSSIHKNIIHLIWGLQCILCHMVLFHTSKNLSMTNATNLYGKFQLSDCESQARFLELVTIL